MSSIFTINPDFAHELIIGQFPEYGNLTIKEVEEQGHDNRTYRVGNEILIRIPTAESYTLKVLKEQELLMKLAPYLSVQIPTPIKIVLPSKNFPYPFSIYKWLPGKSINLLTLNTEEIIQLAFDLSGFLKELQNVRDLDGPVSGNLNWWRGYNISVYYKAAQKQILELASIINSNKAINLLKRACTTKWNKAHVWIHGDFAIGNILVQNNKLSVVIDFGCSAIGDPACNLVIAWTYLSEKAREVFINEMNLDENTWLRAKAWALWKASFELYKIENKNSSKAKLQKNYQ